MCGIMGVHSPDKVNINTNILSHRGPDDFGIQQLKNINNSYLTLFQSRLSIIGLGEQGHQPYSKYNNYTIIYNGEIYNYKELKFQLIEEKKISFITSTDTEVLYEMLINYGINETLKQINGVFAFSFYDKADDVLYVVRDNLGIKPLYFFNKNNIFSFASEIKAFFKLNLIKPVLNEDVLGEYLANSWVFEPDTLFKDIYKLKSGSYLKYNLKNSKIEETRYWDVDNKYEGKIDLRKIIKSQTIADVPYGIYFSGGIDSTILANTLLSESTKLLNLDLNDEEGEIVKQFSSKFNANIENIKYNKEDLNLYKNILYYLDEPIADAAIIPTFLLAKRAKERNLKVMMSGMGGDEIDAGYTRAKIILNQKKYKFIKFIPLFYLPNSKLKRDLIRLKSFIKNPVPENYYTLTSYLNKNEIDILIGKSWFEGYKKKIKQKVENINGLKKFFYLDFKGFLSSHNNIYTDKASMMASVEVRVPLLDKNLVNNYFEDIHIVNKTTQKTRLKKVLEDELGKDFICPQKRGFRYPISNWLRFEINWKEIIEYFDKNRILNTSLIKKWVKLSHKNMPIVEMKLLLIYTLYQWLIIFNVDIL